MLEGRAEQWILRAGQSLADQFAYRRINRDNWASISLFLKNNPLPLKPLLVAVLDSIQFAIFSLRSIRSTPGVLLYRLTRGVIEPDLVFPLIYWQKLHREWGGKARSTSDAKTLTKKLLDSDRIPDLGYFVNGNWFDKSWQQLPMQSLIGSFDVEDVVIKRDYSERGNHVLYMSVEELQTFPAESFGNFVIQRKIAQHRVFDDLAKGGRVTLRLLTAYPAKGAEVGVISGLVKYSEGGSHKDLIRVIIDLEKNRLLDYGFDGSWRKVSTKNPLVGDENSIPGLDEAKALVVSLHERFPHFQLIGWDLGIDHNGRAWIFEWNADHPAVLHHQIAKGPIFRNAGINLNLD